MVCFGFLYISKLHKSRNLLEVNRQTLGLNYTLGACRTTAALIVTATQGMSLSLSQPVTQGPCQMPCKNPLDTSLSHASSLQKGEKEKVDSRLQQALSSW